MNFINDILDKNQLCTIRDFIFSKDNLTMIWHGTGNNGKSILCKTIPNSVFITLDTFNNSNIPTFSQNSIFILNEMYTQDIQEIIKIIDYIHLHYKNSKLLIITNDSSLHNSLSDNTIISIYFKYNFVEQIHRSTDKLVNRNILDHVNTDSLWIKV